MNIILIAPPAAGKGTQSELICKKYNTKHISTGDLLREVTKKDDAFSKEIRQLMEKGLLISDDIIFKLIKDTIKDSKNNIFDGFPRNIEQAIKFDEILKEINQKIDYVIYLRIDKDILQKRIMGRFVCPTCNKVYNFDDIDNEHYCECGEKLIKRKDDTIEVFENRYQVYIENTKPIIDYYKKQNNFYELDATLSKEDVFKQIEEIINDNN